MEANHIPLIMQRLAQIVAEDRIRKYSTALIVKIIVILKIYGVSYRSSRYFFNNHPEFMEMLNMTDIPNFRTLSCRSLRIDWHFINSSIIDIINPYNDSAAVDSSVVKTCRDTTAQRRRKNGKYKDPESSWGYGTMGYEYGRKVHAAIDTDSLSVMEWKTTTASVYDKNIAFEMIDSIRNYNYILMDAAYDSSDIYDYIFENAHTMPVIDTNRRRGIVQDRLTYNRKLGIALRKKRIIKIQIAVGDRKDIFHS
ncbi:MAG: transposase [Candidatus Thermoplasmatota archaeon]|nr:transposase [Candidatus Thermoplasmatota archaeon]